MEIGLIGSCFLCGTLNFVLDIGVLQGLVLGPIVFVLYTNYLNYGLKFLCKYSFASDAPLLLKNREKNVCLSKGIDHPIIGLDQ